MPLYEYQCDACGQRFEKIQKFSDPPLERCPACAGSLTKLLSSPAIQFKGSGWYITDYAKKPSTDGKTAAKSEDAAEKAPKESAPGDSSKTPSSTPAPAKSDS